MRKQPRALAVTLPANSGFLLATEEGAFPIRDLGPGGLGVWLPKERQARWQTGEEVTAELRYGGRAFPVRLTVRHRGVKLTGFRWVALDQNFRVQLDRWLEPARLAMTLEPVTAITAEDPTTGFARRWFRAPDEKAQLAFWCDGGGSLVTALLVVFHGRWVFRERGRPVRTGRVNPQHPWNGAYGAPNGTADRPGSSAPVLEEASRFLVGAPTTIPGTSLWRFLESGEATQLEDTAPPVKRVA